MSKTPMLDLMERCRIFSITHLGGDRYEICEECDLYYRLKLSKEQLRELGEELIGLSEL